MNYRDKLYSTYVSNHMARVFGESNISTIEKQQFPTWRKYYLRFLPADKHARIIDIGCGNGGFIYFLKSMGYKNSCGIDISPEQVQAAKDLGLNDIECADNMEFLKDKKDSYDVIIAKDIIEHFSKENIIELLTLIFNSLKPEGMVIIHTPNAESPFGSRYRYFDFTHSIAFTKSSLSQILRVAGFERINCYPAGPVPHGLRSAVRFLLWNIINTMIKFYMLIETGNNNGIYTQNIIAVGYKSGKVI